MLWAAFQLPAARFDPLFHGLDQRHWVSCLPMQLAVPQSQTASLPVQNYK